MQSKVSIVIPCYNKEKFISGMFDSILAQEWDNIELILVNDGSTDRTFSIIKEYKPLFISRGFEVIIIDQENQGVSAAVRTGLQHANGKYICHVDADDALDPQYISKMAYWLEKNPDYDWVACDSFTVTDNSRIYTQSFPDNRVETICIEYWLFYKIQRAAWIYMIRSEYMEHCNIINLFYTGREGNQEAQLFIPLLLGGGKLKYLEMPLIYYNTCDPTTHRSYYDNYESSKKRWQGYINCFNEIIMRMSLNDENKKRLYILSDIAYHICALKETVRVFNSVSQYISDATESLCKKINKYFNLIQPIELSDDPYYLHILCTAIIDNILKRKGRIIQFSFNRVIAWGALGMNARIILPFLKGTTFEADELWDTTGDGFIVKKPDICKLKGDDLVIVFPSISKEILNSINLSKCINVMLVEDIFTYVSKKLFPDFYNGNIGLTYLN